MSHGGKRHGAGRHPGTRNKASAWREQLVAQTGPTPLEALVRVFRYYLMMAEQELQRDKPNQARVNAAFARVADVASKAANFVHPRVTAISHSAQLDPTKLSDHELSIIIPILRKCVVDGPSLLAGEEAEDVTH